MRECVTENLLGAAIQNLRVNTLYENQCMNGLESLVAIVEIQSPLLVRCNFYLFLKKITKN